MLAHLTYFHNFDYVGDFINMARYIRLFVFVKWLKNYAPCIFSTLDINSKISFQISPILIMQLVKMKSWLYDNIYNCFCLLERVNSC